LPRARGRALHQRGAGAIISGLAVYLMIGPSGCGHPATGPSRGLGFAGDRVSAPCRRNPVTGFHRTRGPAGPLSFPGRACRRHPILHLPAGRRPAPKNQGRL